MKKQTTDEGFKKWFDEYFCNQQGDDSPYGYNDVKTAFEQGGLSAQEEIKGLKNSIAKLIIDNTRIKEDILADVEKLVEFSTTHPIMGFITKGQIAKLKEKK